MRRLRRLSNREYNNVIRDLLGDNSRPADRFLEETYPNGYDNGSAALSVQSDQAAAFQSAAETLAARAVAGDLRSLLGGCEPATQGHAVCVDRLLDGFARRAFRRPLTASERQRLRAAFDAGVQAAGIAMGVQAAIEVVLQSPQFLYREELGPANADAKAGPVLLTPFEQAAQLSFLLVGSLPDDALLVAAGEGRLSSAGDMQREAARLLSTPAARQHLSGFFHQWLASDRIAFVTKDPKLYPSWNRDLAASMKKDLDLFFEASLGAAGAPLAELFSSTAAFIDARLGKVYGLAETSRTPRKVALDAGTRRGLLTRAGFLAVHAAPDSSAPVSRGVFVLEALLCKDLPPPPADVVQQLPPAAAARAQTTRQRFMQHAADPACRGCHTLIDGVGFGFEQFDAIGALRTSENGLPVDTRGQLSGTDVDGPFEGASELGARLLRSRSFAECAARQIHRFALGEIEPHDSGRALADGFHAETKLTQHLEALVASPTFLYRAFEPR